MLEAVNVTFSVGPKKLLQDVYFQSNPGELTVIIGPNGAGKSTLMKCLTGDLKLSAGSVTLDGTSIRDIPPVDLASRRAVLPQNSQLSFPFSVEEVVMLGVLAGAHGLGENELRSRVVEALRRVGLGAYLQRFYQELSGGEKQRVHLARVLCQVWSPQQGGVANYLFLDEPTASLDLKHQIDVLEAGRRYANDGGGVVAVLHDIDLACVYADKVFVLNHGKLVAHGAPKDVVTSDLLRSVYHLSDQMLETKWGHLAKGQNLGKSWSDLRPL
ncbi:heme ABC transporter ATP-binding protein [Pseudovibrio sp. Tun.PSC04-5.I4]|uniref:heme ABC transporter ATP-binding protein n=1 Tax=Pseudovibrio sp. Tun.PSC04-5.I4 TaxID=1798213 RepID=UPI00087E8802|nr:heme ABC transporter ATP-binding protein [Pseudovibrio sp. Tun.PSC04-5.I4]SDR25477.1 iron complex transport system ATP-binding protein [Pseudovibrio sp. Tun.PSC04-5.I4]